MSARADSPAYAYGELQAAIDCALYILRTPDCRSANGPEPRLTLAQRVVYATGLLTPYATDARTDR